jgi:hypothetical protein
MKGMSSEGIVTKGRLINRRCGRNCRGLIDRSLLGTPVLDRGYGSRMRVVLGSTPLCARPVMAGKEVAAPNGQP